MNIVSKIGQSVYDFLGKKIDKSNIKTVSGSLATTVHFKEVALYIATSYIANTIGKCEFLVYENGKEVQNQLYYALNISPNPNYSGNRLKNKLVYQYFLKEGGLLIPKRDCLYVADDFQIDKSTGLKDWIFEGIAIDEYIEARPYRAREVFYFQQDNKNVTELLSSMYADYGVLLSSAISNFQKENGSKYKLVMDNVKAGSKDFNDIYEEVIKKQLEDFLKSPNAVYPQYQGYDLTEISNGQGRSSGRAGTGSADIIALRKEAFEMVAQALKIPNSLLLGNITNLKEVIKLFLTFCIDPLAECIGNELTRKTFGYQGLQSGSYVKVDTSQINHFDLLDIAEKVDKLISSGVTSIDEVRKILGMDLLNTEFSQTHFITKNYATAETALTSEPGKEVQE